MHTMEYIYYGKTAEQRDYQVQGVRQRERERDMTGESRKEILNGVTVKEAREQEGKKQQQQWSLGAVVI